MDVTVIPATHELNTPMDVDLESRPTTPAHSSKHLPEPSNTPSPTRKKANLNLDSPASKLLSKNTLANLPRTTRAKLYKPFELNPDMPDTGNMNDETLVAIIQSEKAYQMVTTHQQRFAKVISHPSDLTNKLNDSERSMTQYLEKAVPEAKKDQTSLVEACGN